MKHLVTLIVILALTGCQQQLASMQNSGTLAGGALGGLAGGLLGNSKNRELWIAGGVITGALIGNQIGRYLDEQERQRAEAASQTAIVTGRDQTWQSTDKPVHGQVKCVKEQQQPKQVSVPVLKDKIDRVPPLDLIGANYSATANANLRGGPGTDYKTVGSIGKGDLVEVIGQVQGEPWYMVGTNHVGTGFVHKDLLSPVPAESQAPQSSATQIAAHDVVQKDVAATQTCRTVRQVVTLANGSEQEEEITACNGPNGWEVI